MPRRLATPAPPSGLMPALPVPAPWSEGEAGAADPAKKLASS
jgi:hypothetical protein